MGRAERRREDRERRRGGGAPASNVPGWEPPTNQLRSAAFVPNTPEENARQRQDFLAGTVFAAGAGHMFPTGGEGEPMVTAMFAVFIAEDDSTFAVAPQLREAFRLLDQHGGSALHERLTVGTAWGTFDAGPDPLVKLKLEFHDQPPLRGKVDIVLMAENYRDSWQHIVGGGLVAVTTLERMQRASSAPDASFGSAMEASLLFGMGSSPAIEHLMRMHDW